MMDLANTIKHVDGDHGQLNIEVIHFDYMIYNAISVLVNFR